MGIERSTRRIKSHRENSLVFPDGMMSTSVFGSSDGPAARSLTMHRFAHGEDELGVLLEGGPYHQHIRPGLAQ